MNTISRPARYAADRSLKLQSFEVIRRGEDIYVVASQIDRATQPRPSDKEIQDILAKSVRLDAKPAAERDGGLQAFAPDAATVREIRVTVTATPEAANPASL